MITIVMMIVTAAFTWWIRSFLENDSYIKTLESYNKMISDDNIDLKQDAEKLLLELEKIEEERKRERKLFDFAMKANKCITKEEMDYRRERAVNYKF